MDDFGEIRPSEWNLHVNMLYWVSFLKSHLIFETNEKWNFDVNKWLVKFIKRYQLNDQSMILNLNLTSVVKILLHLHYLHPKILMNLSNHQQFSMNPKKTLLKTHFQMKSILMISYQHLNQNSLQNPCLCSNQYQLFLNQITLNRSLLLSLKTWKIQSTQTQSLTQMRNFIFRMQLIMNDLLDEELMQRSNQLIFEIC